jgi:tetratricopeptide (TPR) repeat protein
MSARTLGLAAAVAALSGCVTPPPAVGPADTSTPAVALSPAPAAALEARHLERAQSYASARNWADALVQWELLALLKPDAQEYRNSIAQTRKRIHDATVGLSSAAAQARQQGNLDHATLLYLRVLNVDRDNVAAAQALRDIDAERTRRSYLNRPPRGAM